MKLFLVHQKKLETREKLQIHSWNQSQITEASHLIVFARIKNIDDNYIDNFLNNNSKITWATREQLSAYENMMKWYFSNLSIDSKTSWARDQVFLALWNVMNFLAQKQIDSCAIWGFDPVKYDEILELDKLGLSSVVVLPIWYRSITDKNSIRPKVRFSKEEIIIEFPEFITHVPLSKNKWKKIGYNAIHASPHFTMRNAFVGAMHTYIEKHIPKGLKIKGPVKTEVIVYAPLNYGNVKSLMDKKTGIRKLSWKPPAEGYKPNWDIGNLALIWIKALDDVLIKKGILPDDTVEFLRRTTYEFIPVSNFKDRKLVYKLKSIKRWVIIKIYKRLTKVS